MPAFHSVLQAITKLAGGALRTFAFSLLIIDVLYGSVMAGLAIWIAAEGSIFRGILAGVLVYGLIVGFGFFLSLQKAAFHVIQRAIEEFKLGSLIFDDLIEGSIDSLRSEVTELDARQLEKVLSKTASRSLTTELNDSSASGISFWLCSQILRLSVWATVRIVVRTSSKDGQTVSLHDVKDKFAGIIDQLLFDYFKEHIRRIYYGCLSILTALTILISYAIRQIPL